MLTSLESPSFCRKLKWNVTVDGRAVPLGRREAQLWITVFQDQWLSLWAVRGKIIILFHEALNYTNVMNFMPDFSTILLRLAFGNQFNWVPCRSMIRRFSPASILFSLQQWKCTDLGQWVCLQFVANNVQVLALLFCIKELILCFEKL